MNRGRIWLGGIGRDESRPHGDLGSGPHGDRGSRRLLASASPRIVPLRRILSLRGRPMTNLLEFRTRALCHVLVVATTAWLLTGCASDELIELGPARDGGGDPRDATDTTGRPDLGGDTIVSDTSSDSDVVTDVVDAVDANDGSGGDVVEDTDTFVPGCPGLGCACTPATAAALCEGYPCVDGFCCTDACDGACETCAAAGREGQCTPHAAATDPDNDCTEQPGNTCGLSGLCDGTGECAYWGSETYCNDNESCSTGDRCNGRGECRGEVPDECGPGPANECCAGTCADGAGLRHLRNRLPRCLHAERNYQRRYMCRLWRGRRRRPVSGRSNDPLRRRRADTLRTARLRRGDLYVQQRRRHVGLAHHGHLRRQRRVYLRRSLSRRRMPRNDGRLRRLGVRRPRM
jgi:hypothetical protein